MFDFNNPQSEHVFAAAQEMDRIQMIAHKMTVASSETRRLLFQLTKAPVEELLSLNRDYFGNSESIRGRIAELANALVTLRNLGDSEIDKDRSDGIGDCPHCKTPIKRFQLQNDPTPTDPWVIYCPQCSEAYTAALDRLSLADVGFGTAAI